LEDVRRGLVAGAAGGATATRAVAQWTRARRGLVRRAAGRGERAAAAPAGGGAGRRSGRELRCSRAAGYFGTIFRLARAHRRRGRRLSAARLLPRAGCWAADVRSTRGSANDTNPARRSRTRLPIVVATSPAGQCEARTTVRAIATWRRLRGRDSLSVGRAVIVRNGRKRPCLWQATRRVRPATGRAADHFERSPMVSVHGQRGRPQRGGTEDEAGTPHDELVQRAQDELAHARFSMGRCRPGFAPNNGNRQRRQWFLSVDMTLIQLRQHVGRGGPNAARQDSPVQKHDLGRADQVTASRSSPTRRRQPTGISAGQTGMDAPPRQAASPTGGFRSARQYNEAHWATPSPDIKRPAGDASVLSVRRNE